MRGPSPFSQILGGPTDEENPEKSPIPAISLLPEGSILENVMIPRYDKERRLASVLRCQSMVLEKADLISGKTVAIESYLPDRTLRARVNLTQALYNQRKGLLRADETVTISSDRLDAVGTGLIYSLEESRGFLKGPAKTTITQPTPTAMNNRSSGLRATAFLGASLLPLIAAPPAVDPAESALIQQQAAPLAAEVAEASAAARDEIRSVLKDSLAANQATLQFLNEADLLSAAETTEPLPEAKRLELPPNPDRTTVDCKGGLYFDSKAGVAVFLKNVVVKDPSYDLTAASELKIFFEKPPEKPAPKKNEKPADKPADGTAAKEPAPKETPPPADPVSKEVPADKKTADKPAETKKPEKKNSMEFGSGSFGNPKTIVATGAVKIVQKNTPQGKDPVQASGNMVHYDLKTGTITISGGYPWFIQGSVALRASTPNAWIRVDKDYNISSDPNGGWTTDLNLKDIQKR